MTVVISDADGNGGDLTIKVALYDWENAVGQAHRECEQSPDRGPDEPVDIPTENGTIGVKASRLLNPTYSSLFGFAYI